MSNPPNIIHKDNELSESLVKGINTKTTSVPKAVNNEPGVDPNDQKDAYGAAELTITKTANKDPAKYNVEEDVVFTINVYNSGTWTFYVTGLTDYIPSGLSYKSDTGGGVHFLNTVTWGL
jgi:uncharacterized repeat protein (TIGR01451 family)